MTGVLALAVLGTSGVGWAMLSHVDSNLERVDVFGNGERPPKGSGDAINYLLVGADRREGISRRTLKELHLGSEECNCTDTIILIHVSKSRDTVTMVSFPRDSYVDFPAFTDAEGTEHREARGKINAAYARGGPKHLVETVERATDIRIDHYIEVNFLSFVDIVDELGKVEICTNKALRDSKSGLDLDRGTHQLDGVESLKYVRARSLDPIPDLGRMQRQQKFIASIIHKALGSELLLNPGRLRGFINAALDSLRVDENLKAEDLMDLATRLQGLSTRNVTMVTVPVSDWGQEDPELGELVIWDEDAAETLFRAIRDDHQINKPDESDEPKDGTGDEPGQDQDEEQKDEPEEPKLTVPPEEVRIQVFNGTTINGLAGRTTDDLREVGFTIGGPPSNADERGYSETVIRYDSRYTESIKTLAAALPGSRLEKVPELGGTLHVIVGSSYDGAETVTVDESAEEEGSEDQGETPTPTPTIETKTAAENVCS